MLSRPRAVRYLPFAPMPFSGACRRGRWLTTGAWAAVVVVTVAACGAAGSPDLDLSPSAPSSVATEPRPAPSESLLTEAPDTHSSVGTLADGFPSDLLAVPEGAEVLMSSAAQVGDTDVWDVSLNLRTPQDTAALVEGLRQPLLAAGFAEIAPTQAEAGLAAQTTFTRGDGTEILVVGVLDRDGIRTLTIGGRVRVAA